MRQSFIQNIFLSIRLFFMRKIPSVSEFHLINFHIIGINHQDGAGDLLFWPIAFEFHAGLIQMPAELIATRSNARYKGTSRQVPFSVNHISYR